MTSSASTLLQSIQILVTGVPEKEKRRLHDIAKSQGAVILSTANANDPPHVVITRTVGSPRYFTILKRNASIPIVTPEWLTSSIEKGTRLPYADFAAGVFQGLVICFSGLSVAEKKEFSKHVESQGGRHSPVLDRSCTHLVTDSTQSDKFIYAQLHGIYCITPAWIEESLSAGRCLDPAKYLIIKAVSQQQQQHSQQQQQSLLAKQASLQRARDASGITNGELTDNTDANNDDDIVARNNINKNLGRSDSEEPSLKKVAAIAVNTTARGINLETKPSSRLGNAAAAAAVAATGAATDIDVPISATQTGAAPWTTLDHNDDDPLFLDSCFIWVTCCTPAEEQETLVLCAQGGAKRFTEPHPTLITHVIVGSSLQGAQADAVSSFISEHKEVPVVGLEWLRRSVARSEVLVADERFTVAVPTSGGGLGGGGGNNVLGGGGNNGSMSLLGYHSNDGNSILPNNLNGAINGGGVGGGDIDASGSGFLLNRQNSGASLLGGFLDNCYFTLAAVRGTPEGDAAERLIRMHGGRIFSTSVPTSGKACFAICPYSLPPHKVHALRMSHTDFAAVNEAQRFTLWWLECCVQAGQLLPCQAGTACFQPLPFTLPLKDMDQVSVSISGYDPSVRAAIQRTVEIVGGRVSVEYMTAKDTHLIVPVAHGKKYKYAARYGVIPVTAAWLLESVKAGKALPPDNFAPLLPSTTIAAGGGNNDSAVDTSQQVLPSTSSLRLTNDKPPISTQQTNTSLYAAAIAGPAALNSSMNGQPSTSHAPHVVVKSSFAKPSLKEKAARLREAAKRTGGGTTTNTSNATTAIAKKPSATAFDFDSLLGPLQNKTGGGAGATLASAAIASLVGGCGAGPSLPAGATAEATSHQGANKMRTSGGAGDAGVPLPGAIHHPGETEGAAELDAAMNQVSSLLDRMKGRVGVFATGNGSGHSSQQDMPPPPARGGGGGGGGGDGGGGGRNAQEESGRGSKRNREDSGGAAPVPRRSTRRGGGAVSGISELVESEGIEMSQQVGYESAAVEVVEVVSRGKEGHTAAAAAAVAKERLTRAATRNRRGQTNTRDILDGF